MNFVKCLLLYVSKDMLNVCFVQVKCVKYFTLVKTVFKRTLFV